MCGPVGGCGGGAAVAQAMKSGVPSQVDGAGGGSPEQKGGGAHAHSATQAQAGVKFLTNGDVRGAWGSNVTFKATSTSTDSDHHGEAGGGHEKTIYARTSEPDMALANNVMQAAMKLLAPLDYQQVAQGSTKDHLSIPESVKKAWAEQFPNLPVPNKLVFDKKSGKAVGALFVGGAKAKDLGMGTLHAHTGGGPIMQHMWFIPNNMNLAFSDVSQKQAAIQAAVAR